MIPDKVVSPSWSGDWKATTDQPNSRDRRLRLLMNSASRICAYLLIFPKRLAELPKEGRSREVETVVRAEVAKVLALPSAEDVAPERMISGVLGVALFLSFLSPPHAATVRSRRAERIRANSRYREVMWATSVGQPRTEAALTC